MQLKIFSIPSFGSEALEEEMNKFLRTHRILQIERHFCPDNGGYWAVMVEYVLGDPVAEVPPAERREKKDYTAGLTDEQKQRYERYREIRATVAAERSLPAYLVFTNNELAILAALPDIKAPTAQQTKGIAPSRLKDFLVYFQNSETNEESGQPDAEDSQHGEPV